MEDRRKLVACLELCGKSDHEITRLLDGADRKGELSGDPFVPQRIQDYMDKAKVSSIKQWTLYYENCFTRLLFFQSYRPGQPKWEFWLLDLVLLGSFLSHSKTLFLVFMQYEFGKRAIVAKTVQLSLLGSQK